MIDAMVVVARASFVKEWVSQASQSHRSGIEIVLCVVEVGYVPFWSRQRSVLRVLSRANISTMVHIH
jgi:hypothetical protein